MSTSTTEGAIPLCARKPVTHVDGTSSSAMMEPGGGETPAAVRLRFSLPHGIVAVQSSNDRKIVAAIVAMVLLGMIFAFSVVFALR